MKICFIDTLGLTYDGSTLQKRGLGGSESAVILMAKELAKIGFNVTVFNDCESDESVPGIYDSVLYRPLRDVETVTDPFDVMVGSRSVASFAPRHIQMQFKSFNGPLPDFTALQNISKHKVLWMHDTFCDGDQLIEPFLLDGFINEIFALSDFHVQYVSAADHGARRMPEVMKRFIFQTRNGIVKYHDWVDISQKDPNSFVYNASVTKGMVPLVENVWPEIRKHAPDARLTIIGGYYRFRSDHGPDKQEQDWRELVAANPDINFTGVIKQSEIADILAKASYMIYPTAFPETFGISTLESLAYNTPLITTNFGALEETAIDTACYKIPFSVTPNSLFPNIDQNLQVQRFVNMTLQAYHNKYLHQQKMYACNAVKDICTWDTVALQWKQHLFYKLGQYLPVEEYRTVTKINHRVRQVFGRRFLNPEELQEPRNVEKPIGIITAVYNAEDYVERCIRSVASQDYDNYYMYIIDDCSTDNTVNVIKKTIESFPREIQHRFVLIRNKENKGAVHNHYRVLTEFLGTDEFYIILDGDDWLVNDPNIFNKYNNHYHEGAEFTYGSCWSVADNIPLVAQPYPEEIKQARAYRQHKFNWNMPYTHLRTFHSKLLQDLTKEDIMIDGEWPRAGGDTALFYYFIEKADPNKVVCIPDIVYNYNDLNPINDYKVNSEEQSRTANRIIERR